MHEEDRTLLALEHLVDGLGFGVWGLGFGFWGSGLRVQGFGFRVECLGFRILWLCGGGMRAWEFEDEPS